MTEATEEQGKEAVLDHFESKADGFTNPNAEKPEEHIEPIVSPEQVAIPDDGEDIPYTYSERLEKLEVSDEQAHEIIDDICEKGSFMEAVVILKKRQDKEEIKAVFITRDTRSQGFIAIEAAKRHGNIPMVYEKIMGELQLAASLIHYNGENFKSLTGYEDDKEFQIEIIRRVTLLAKLPAPVTVVLTRKLSAFDLKVTAVMAPGYEDFF